MSAPISPLIQTLRPLLGELRTDLLERAKAEGVSEGLRAAYEEVKRQERTADPFDVWVDDRAAQIAAAWVLSCVFVRTLEDRGLLDRHRIAGEGAEDSEQQFTDLAPFLTPRDYLLCVFKELSRLPGARHVFDGRHNPVWVLGPSAAAARKLIDFFRRKNDRGELQLTFASSETRFLGDLYQDLYEDVREKYALLQTPDFVEELILDETLERAIRDFGLERVKLIDPTCGSGHFLLGAYKRLFNRWTQEQPGERPEVLALQALKQVAGVDLNPYAVAIARFRLALLFLECAGITKLKNAPESAAVVCVGDSLLFGHGQRDFASATPTDLRHSWGNSLFMLEDADEAEHVLSARYHAVVGNPPYITEKDSARREKYRSMYSSAAGKFALVAPFTERFFTLATEGGYVGMINANSFIKREFGKALIESVLPQYDLQLVADTSGAFIPGHGTPTIIIIGRRAQPSDAPVLAVLGIRGEPSTPEDPANGRVWASIRDHRRDVGFENEFISVVQLERARLRTHPWSLRGGGASEVQELLEQRAACRLRDVVSDVGFASFPASDEVFAVPADAQRRLGIPEKFTRTLIVGENVRDWGFVTPDSAIAPYDGEFQLVAEAELGPAHRHFWRYKSAVLGISSFGGKTRGDGGEPYWAWYRWIPERLKRPFRLVFAAISTHNHFVLERGGRVFNNKAPVVLLQSDATEAEHLALLAYLNSSTACFWMKQVCYPKGTHSEARPEKGIPEENRYEFSGTAISDLPLPARSTYRRLSELASEMESWARLREQRSPVPVLKQALQNETPDLARACAEGETKAREALWRMVCVQEEIDWLVYELFGLAETTCLGVIDAAVRPDDRPFRWTSQSAPDSVPAVVLAAYEQRRSFIDRHRELRMFESPVYKRLWLGTRGVFAHKVATYSDRFMEAARRWLADRLEREIAGSQVGRIHTARELASGLERNFDIRAVAKLLCGDSDPNLEQLFAELLANESVPFLAGCRYSDSGFAKRRVWDQIWEAQRRQESGNEVKILSPPTYDNKDFHQQRYWSLRGKFDVPKEQFITYPGAESDDDPAPLYGWAGWNDLQRAIALASLYQKRKTDDGWGGQRLAPLLAGLVELLPWLKQWHNEPNPDFGGQRLGEFYEAFVESEARAMGLTTNDLAAWRPERSYRGKRQETVRPRIEALAEPKRSAPDADGVLAAVKALDSGMGAELGALAQRLAAPKPAISKVAKALVQAGLLRETSARPKRWEIATAQGNEAAK